LRLSTNGCNTISNQPPYTTQLSFLLFEALSYHSLIDHCNGLHNEGESGMQNCSEYLTGSSASQRSYFHERRFYYRIKY
jgi:hypothetical protein